LHFKDLPGSKAGRLFQLKWDVQPEVRRLKFFEQALIWWQGFPVPATSAAR
jgi:hypothetical protein